MMDVASVRGPTIDHVIAGGPSHQRRKIFLPPPHISTGLSVTVYCTTNMLHKMY